MHLRLNKLTNHLFLTFQFGERNTENDETVMVGSWKLEFSGGKRKGKRRLEEKVWVGVEPSLGRQKEMFGENKVNVTTLMIQVKRVAVI